jgi:hypothetical protein
VRVVTPIRTRRESDRRLRAESTGVVTPIPASDVSGAVVTRIHERDIAKLRASRDVLVISLVNSGDAAPVQRADGFERVAVKRKLRGRAMEAAHRAPGAQEFLDRSLDDRFFQHGAGEGARELDAALAAVGYGEENTARALRETDTRIVVVMIFSSTRTSCMGTYGAVDTRKQGRTRRRCP